MPLSVGVPISTIRACFLSQFVLSQTRLALPIMKALDLFCCAGGASAGLVSAGFDVTGVDIVDRPSYLSSGASRFVLGDALSLSTDFLREFDFIWASPPCQFATAYKRKKRADGSAWVGESPNLIPATRALLTEAGIPWVIENVDQKAVRAELRSPVRLCGSSFGLDVRRHRLFETSGWAIDQVACDHGWQTPRFPPAGNRVNLRSTVEIGVWRIPMEVQHAAMGGLEWMSREELSQAIPPAYSNHIAQSWLKDC